MMRIGASAVALGAIVRNVVICMVTVTQTIKTVSADVKLACATVHSHMVYFLFLNRQPKRSSV